MQAPQGSSTTMKPSMSMLFSILTEEDEDVRAEKTRRVSGDSGSVVLQQRAASPPPPVDAAARPQQRQRSVQFDIAQPPPLVLTPEEVLQELLGDLYVDWAWLTMGDLLGEGGFAEVHRALLRAPCAGGGGGGGAPVVRELSVAVKQLRASALRGPQDLREFLTEANLLRKLHHGNVVRLLGVGARDTGNFVSLRESVFVVQELMSGGDLKQMLVEQMRDPFTPRYSKGDALRWATEVAQAMHYLHAVCRPMIIHRDLKPDNVLLTGGDISTRIAKVADFGLHKRGRGGTGGSYPAAGSLAAAAAGTFTSAASDQDKSYYGGNAFLGAGGIGGSAAAAGLRAAASGGGGGLGALPADELVTRLLSTPALELQQGAHAGEDESVHRKVAAVQALERSVRSGSAFFAPACAANDAPAAAAAAAAAGPPPRPPAADAVAEVAPPPSTATSLGGRKGNGGVPELSGGPGGGGGVSGDAGLCPLLVADVQQGMRSVSGSARFIDATQKVGSLLYMAPEVLKGGRYNEKVDVFAFGVILYELLSGALVAARVGDACDDDATSQQRTGPLLEYAEQVARGRREQLPSFWPAPVRQLIGACWAADPSQRPDFGEVVQRLHGCRQAGAAEAMDALRPRPGYNPTADCGCCAIM